MIRFSAIGYILGQFLAVLSATLLLPLTLALRDGDAGLGPLTAGAGVTLAAGVVLIAVCTRPSRDLSTREAILLVSVVWACAGLFGGIPFWLSPYFPSFTDAVFEAASGFTTTGATVLPQVDVLPRSLQLWRHFTHWLGGMGIVLLGLAVLPLIGIGGAHLYRAEFSGAKSEKLRPRITETAFALWRIYFVLSLLEFLLLRLAGMSRFEAVCHTFSTLGTGGFSTRNASIAGFQSPLIETIIIVFMLLSGISFARHYQLWIERRGRLFFGDAEIRGFLALVAGATLAIGLTLILQDGAAPGEAFRAALFQVSSITTTTGFVTADFERWRPLPQLILLALMFAGGCTGSTAGGLKVFRLMLLAQVVRREFRRMTERHGVFAIRVGGQVIPETAVQGVLNLVYLAFLVNFVACLLLAAAGVDVLTTISAVAASMFNIGPGLGAVGPVEHYGHLPALAKWVLAGCMIAGRLEFYTLLVLLSRSFWAR